MAEKITIEYALCGSLSSSPGESGIIYSSSEILNNKELSDEIFNLENKLQSALALYNTVDNQDQFILFYLLNISINKNHQFSKILIKVIPEFTPFPNLNRFYNRREYYVITEGRINDFNFLIKSIPESVQYKRKKHDSEPIDLLQEPQNDICDEEMLYIILKGFFDKKPLIINKRLDSQENVRLLKTLNFLPGIYKDYIQYGLGLKINDEFAIKYLHLFTSIDGEKSIEELGSNINQRDFILNKFVSAFASKNFQFDDDLEIRNKTNFTEKNNLYELFACHYTYSFCQHFLNDEIENINSYNFIFEQIKSLIKTFIERPELFERIILLYKALAKQKESDEQTFNLFWNKYFSLKEFANKKFGPLLDADFDFHTSKLWAKANSFDEIILISNNLFPDAVVSFIDLIRNQIKFDYLIKSAELNPEDFTSIIFFYNHHKQEFSAKLSINDLIVKFKIDDKYEQLNGDAITLLLTPDLINEIQPEIIAPLLKHSGLKEFLSLYVESDYLLIKKSEIKQFVQSELLKPDLVALLINEKTNWIFLTLSADEKKNISDKFYDYIINQIESKTNKRQDFQTLLKAENLILTEEQVNSFISQFFSKKLKTPSATEFIEEILSIANKKLLQLNISSAFLIDYDTQLVQILPIIYKNSNIFDKENFKQFSKELLEKIWNINNYEIVVKANLSDTILKTDVDLKEDFYALLMQNIKNYFQSLDFQSLHKNFLDLIEIKLNDKGFWNAFSKSELPDHLKDKYSSEPFNRKIILELYEVYKNNFQSTFTDSYLPFFIYRINRMLYQKYFKNKGFKALKTVSLINKNLRIIIYTFFLICITFLIWVSVLYVKVNSTNKQLRLQNQGLDSLKREILKVKAKNDSLINYIKTDSTFTAKPSSETI